MKKLFFISFLVLNNTLNAQTISDYGQWHYVGNVIEGPTHFEKPKTFPPATNIEGQVTVTYSAKEKEKMIKILETFKEVYPKPKYHSYVSRLWNWANTTDKAKVAKREYRFGYQLELQPEKMWVEGGKLANKKMMFVNMDATTRNSDGNLISILVNYIPPSQFGMYSDCPKPQLEISLSYKNEPGKNYYENAKLRRDTVKGVIFSITNTDYTFDEAEKLVGKNMGVPTAKFNTDADKYFVWRRFTSSAMYSGSRPTVRKDDKNKEHRIYNTVILSHNNQMPYIPITIGELIENAYQINEENHIQLRRQNWDYTEKDLDEMRERNEKQRTNMKSEYNLGKTFLDEVKEYYSDKLEQHAIVDIAFNETFSKILVYDNYAIYDYAKEKSVAINKELIGKIFLSDPKQGKAYYRFDRNFYRNISDGEIRTITLSWIENVRMPTHPNYQKGNSLLNDQVKNMNFGDNPEFFWHHFYQKFDWKKLESVLGK